MEATHEDFKVVAYMLCDRVFEINKRIEIGYVFPFCGKFEAFLKGFERISNNGWKYFDTKQEAIDSLIKAYKESKK